MLAGGFLLFIGLSALVSAGVLARRVWQVRSYVAVRGRVVARGLDAADPTEAGGDAQRYETAVRYEYTFGGTVYTGERLTPVTGARIRSNAARDLARLPDEVTVYVNPADPADSVLGRAGFGLTLTAAAAGVIAVLIGTALMVD
ncbi:DUF3592 domain-containing protein [Mycobacterium sp. NPDC003323]